MKLESASRLRVLKKQFEKKLGRVLSFEQLLEEMMDICENSGVKSLMSRKKSAQTNAQTESKRKVFPQAPVLPQVFLQTNKKSSRHIPTSIKRQVEALSKGICEYPDCCKPAEIFHHTRRFSLYRNHGEDSIVLLCKSHERIIHAGLIENELENSASWQPRLFPDLNDPQYEVDRVVQKYR